MASWPITLPPITTPDGYSETTPDVLLRTNMDAGPAKVRRRFTAGVRPITISHVLTAAEVDILDTFVVTTIEGGALTFTMDDPRTQVTKTFRLIEQPTYTGVGGDNYQVSLKLEILP